MKDKFLLFLKGFLMGICDLIPGISGGTIAFITGIYEKLIGSVKTIPELIYGFLKGKKSKKNIKKIDFVFLLILFAGIGTALLTGSRIIKFLLDNYFSYTIAFFIGLVLASSKIIFDNIKNHNLKNILFCIFGLIFGILSSILIPLNINPSLYYVFFGGFLAISAMFLPGISGAFVLLILGLYEFMIDVLHNIKSNINYFSVFVVGALLGMLAISRVIDFLFKKDRCKTLYFLLGLVLGSLSNPIKKILSANLQLLDVSIIIFFIILGVFLVVIINSMRSESLPLFS